MLAAFVSIMSRLGMRNHFVFSFPWVAVSPLTRAAKNNGSWGLACLLYSCAMRIDGLCRCEDILAAVRPIIPDRRF